VNADLSTAPDIRERSQMAGAEPTYLDRRLFMQFLAFGAAETPPLVRALAAVRFPGVLYEDIHDAFGVGLLTFHEEADFFVDELRAFLRQPPFSNLVSKPEYTMLGRTYALGNERDLADALIHRPRQKLCDPAMPWAIWYPLRRKGAFEQLPAADQRVILMEHGGVGHAYGRAGHSTDIRLACHGMDRNDNDFVIGLLGPALYPLSSLVQRMRQTRQTSQYLERLGPFFVGRAVWRQPESA
jgi:chlorite dismutase